MKSKFKALRFSQYNHIVYLINKQVKVPVIIVGCKLDMRDEGYHISLEEVMAPIMQRFREIETCIECSAANLVQVCQIRLYFSLLQYVLNFSNISCSLCSWRQWIYYRSQIGIQLLLNSLSKKQTLLNHQIFSIVQDKELCFFFSISQL